ncbi:MAG TPA: hypothetical protein VJN39_14800 [Gemmatimonadales bacterium]|nr:hypothetical protein [Gemmatimonadales bacterium]
MSAETPLEGRIGGHEVAPGLSAYRATRAEMAAVGQRNNWVSLGHPTLSVLIYNTTLCMKLKVVVSEWPKDSRRLRQTVLREAEFRPGEVTPAKLVEWAYRALADILAEQAGLQG